MEHAYERSGNTIFRGTAGGVTDAGDWSARVNLPGQTKVCIIVYMTKTTKYQITNIINLIDDPYIYVEYINVNTNVKRSIQKYDEIQYELIFVHNDKYVNRTLLNENTPIIVELFNDNPQIKFILENEPNNYYN